jgi:predicted RNA-binding protein
MLILEAVDMVEPQDERTFLLKSIYGEQKTVVGKIRFMNLVNHKIVFEG